MNILYEGLKEKGALMLVPSTAVDASSRPRRACTARNSSPGEVTHTTSASKPAAASRSPPVRAIVAATSDSNTA